MSEEQDYLGALEVLHPTLYGHILSHVKKQQRRIETFELKQQIQQPSEEPTDQRIKTLERVNKEIKKQLACYKEEVEQFKKTDETYAELENYQKLITDFNSLYDHYQVSKINNKKLKSELQQSNQRERTFLKLLKKTEQYGAQAEQLEQEYNIVFDEDGLSRSQKKGVVDVGDMQVPRLDLSIIYLQQEEGEDQAEQKQPPAKVNSV